MREDDIKNPRTRKYSNTKYFFIVFERFIKKIFYIILSLLNFNFFSNRKSIFIGKYQDSRFIEFLFFSLFKEYDFVYEFSSGLSNFIKKIGIKNFYKFCKSGRSSNCNIIFTIDCKNKSLDEKSLNFNTDYFFITDNNLENKAVLPYYMYPRTYLNRYDKLDALKNLEKEISIVFSGSTNKNLYNRIKWKNNEGNLILNRCEIIETVESNFKDQICIIKNKDDLKKIKYKKGLIYLFKNEKLENKGKSLLSTIEHLKNISKSEFIITAPGTEMPICHHFIEAIKFGTIPITNYGDLILPKIKKELYLQYSTENELIECINRSLKMSNSEKEYIKNSLIEIYEQNFSPKSFLKRFNNFQFPTEIYANNDHDSVRLREQRLQNI